MPLTKKGEPNKIFETAEKRRQILYTKRRAIARMKKLRPHLNIPIPDIPESAKRVNLVKNRKIIYVYATKENVKYMEQFSRKDMVSKNHIVNHLIDCLRGVRKFESVLALVEENLKYKRKLILEEQRKKLKKLEFEKRRKNKAAAKKRQETRKKNALKKAEQNVG